MASIAKNNLLEKVSQNKICTSVGIKLFPSAEVVFMAKTAGYDSIFLELEHSTFSLSTMSSLCATALAAGITPFVRVPYQCGDGYVQRVLDNGAMGIIFPHIKTAADATNAVSICKFFPKGTRSFAGPLPQLWFAPVPPDQAMKSTNDSGSTVILMVETKEMLENINEIAAVPNVDVLLIGANDLGMELDCYGDWDGKVFLGALETVSAACRKHSKIMGIAGLPRRPDIVEWAIETLGARYVVGGVDQSMLSAGMAADAKALQALDVKQNRETV